jgi:regulator of RNase E activity RraA
VTRRTVRARADPYTRAVIDLTAALVADALDARGLRRQTLPGAIRPLRPGLAVAGPVLPVRVAAADRPAAEPYRMEMAAVEEIRPGEVLLYVCDPDVNAAVFGELFGHAARARGAAGIVADGPIRDAAALAEAAWPVFASAFSPLDTNGRAEVVAIGETLRCGDVEVARGDLIVGDEDGVVLCPAACADDVRAAVRRKLDGESGARADLEQGVPLTVVWERWGVL